MVDRHPDRLQFDDKIRSLVSNQENFRITFSRQRPDNRDIKNAYLKTALIKNQLKYSVTFRYKTRDEVKNYDKNEVVPLIDNLLAGSFLSAVLFTDSEEATLLLSKRSKATLIIRSRQVETPISNAHDRQRQRIITANASWLQALGLAGQDGKILDKAQDKFRQINKYTEIIDHLLKVEGENALLTIADMGSGKGYLTFALYDHLVNKRKLRVKMTGYDLREDMVSLCYVVAAREGFVGLTFQQKGIDQVDTAGTNMVIALHACDVATDMAIAKGIQGGAQYIVVSPCCHKQVRQAMHHQNTLSPILKHGILEERMAEILTDGLRALIMEAQGYRTQVFEFISTEHTSKNLMITGIKAGPDPTAWAKAQAIMTEFGISNHYLADLLGMN
jgi:hypothetical protein